MSDLNMSYQIVCDLVQAYLFELNVGNKLKTTDFKLD